MATPASAAVLRLRRTGAQPLVNTVFVAAAQASLSGPPPASSKSSWRRPLWVTPSSQAVPPPPSRRQPPRVKSGVSPFAAVAGGTSGPVSLIAASATGKVGATLAAPLGRPFSSQAPSGWDGGRGGDGRGGVGVKDTGPAIAIGSALKFKTIVDGKPLTPEDFQGKAVLVVNTASLCGLTPQLKELELVHKRFQGQGLVVLGVPSNDFGGQEPWAEDKIREFYAKDFGVTFPLTSKTVVVGPEAHPLYSAVVAEFGAEVGPQWNFHKLLVGADGNLSGVFGSHLSALEPDVTEAIVEALPTKS